jgi:hypothetical protein
MELSEIKVTGIHGEGDGPSDLKFQTVVRDSESAEDRWESIEGPVIVQPDGSWFITVKGVLLALKPPGHQI